MEMKKESNILTEEEPKYIISLKKRYRILVELRKPVFVEEEFCNEIFLKIPVSHKASAEN